MVVGCDDSPRYEEIELTKVTVNSETDQEGNRGFERETMEKVWIEPPNLMQCVT